MAMTRVRLFGLTIDSEIALPGLPEVEATGEADVVVRRADLRGMADLVVEEAGAFAVRDGRAILVDAPPGMPERNVRLYLLGSAMGMLLHQRGLLPLHANAIALESGAIAVAGPSGAGKSTLAAWLTHHGQKLIGDDVVAVRLEDGQALAFPGVPRFRLWRDAIHTLGLSPDGLERSYVDEDFDKWDVPASSSDLAPEGLALRALYVLEDGPEIAITPLAGAAAVEALFDHTYRGEYVARTGSAAKHWLEVTALARIMPVFRLTRPRDLIRLAQLGQAVLDHGRDLIARTSA